MNDIYYIIEPDGRYTIRDSVTIDELLAISKHIVGSKCSNSAPFTKPSSVKDYVFGSLANKEREQFLCLFLDNGHRLIHEEILFYGTIDHAAVYPREVVKAALQCNASALILAHNHPSGVSEPSHADERITDKIRRACALVDIRVLDHLVVGAEEVVSFAERSLI